MRHDSPDKPPRHAHRSPCPLAGALDLLGDRWTLIVVRDLLYARGRRYGDLAANPECIPTNILAERLRRLEAAGLVERRLYQERPPRFEYHLTARGAALKPAIHALVRWAAESLEGVAAPGEDFYAR
jgi:DNA-binding HxlR family transcriptional regulator